jgi:type VI secretion system secreted protein VgrG
MMQIFTPLGKDVLLIHKLTATEEISKLPTYTVELLHEETPGGFEPRIIDNKQILGQSVSVSVQQEDGETARIFSGIVNRFRQGGRNTNFTFYEATIVPPVWLLTQVFQSRVFQHMSVPDILKKIFEGFDFKDETQGEFKPRNYCVQHRESDFDFAARLMEEEGIYYYFESTNDAHRMIIGNTPESHLPCPSKSKIAFATNVTEKEGFITYINDWRTDYKLQTGKITLWDHKFQLPGKNLEAQQPTLFEVAGNKQLESYDYYAGYARKYDDVDRGGGKRASDLQNIFEDNQKTAKIKMGALDAQFRTVKAESNCSSITAGHRFTLFNHPNKEFNTQYVVESVTHRLEQTPDYLSNDVVAEAYSNNFVCIDFSTPYRPAQTFDKPRIFGTQTATVTGPAGEEIFTDEYGRVKVQFHWDREGQGDANSSCWVRVAQAWAGNRWGMVFIPRVGMEVVVHFLEGDPDQPLITGCVYNPEMMPPYTLPDHKTKMAIKSDSTVGGGGFNELRFEDKKGSEQVFIHGQKDLDVRIRNDRRELIGNDRHLIVKRDKREKIERDKHTLVQRNLIEKIEGDVHRKVEGKVALKTDGSHSYEVGGSSATKVGGSYAIDVSGSYTVKANTIVLEADTGLTIKVGGNFVTVNAAGVQINGTMVMINSGGAALPATPGSIVPPLDPDEAEIADNADPGSKSPTYKNQRPTIPPRKVPTYTKPSHKPKSPKNKDKKSWIEVVLKDDEGDPVPGERYRVTLPDGTTIAEGTLDEKGEARVDNIDPGSCEITFPDIDGRSWKPE